MATFCLTIIHLTLNCLLPIFLISLSAPHLIYSALSSFLPLSSPTLHFLFFSTCFLYFSSSQSTHTYTLPLSLHLNEKTEKSGQREGVHMRYCHHKGAIIWVSNALHCITQNSCNIRLSLSAEQKDTTPLASLHMEQNLLFNNTKVMTCQIKTVPRGNAEFI